jgi:hypothetical protein
MLPVQGDVRKDSLQVDEVDRSVSYDLVGERVVAVPRIAGLRQLHARMVAHDPVGGKLGS